MNNSGGKNDRASKVHTLSLRTRRIVRLVEAIPQNSNARDAEDSRQVEVCERSLLPSYSVSPFKESMEESRKCLLAVGVSPRNLVERLDTECFEAEKTLVEEKLQDEEVVPEEGPELVVEERLEKETIDASEKDPNYMPNEEEDDEQEASAFEYEEPHNVLDVIECRENNTSNDIGDVYCTSKPYKKSLGEVRKRLFDFEVGPRVLVERLDTECFKTKEPPKKIVEERLQDEEVVPEEGPELVVEERLEKAAIAASEKDPNYMPNALEYEEPHNVLNVIEWRENNISNDIGDVDCTSMPYKKSLEEVKKRLFDFEVGPCILVDTECFKTKETPKKIVEVRLQDEEVVAEEGPEVEEDRLEEEEVDDSDKDPDYTPNKDEDDEQEASDDVLDVIEEQRENDASNDIGNVDCTSNPFKESVHDYREEAADHSEILYNSQPSTSFKNVEPILPKHLERFRPFLPKFDVPKYTKDASFVIDTATKGKRTRKYFCPYCKKDFSSLPKHLSSHQNMELVAKLFSLPKDHEDRILILTAIRLWGTWIYNSNRLHNRGVLRVLRRPVAEAPVDASNYITCPNCNMVLRKHRLHRHYKNCSGSTQQQRYRHLHVAGKRVMGRIHEKANAILRNRIFPVLNDDECTSALRYDHAIIVYGNECATKYALSPHHDKMIRANLRVLGRCILHGRKLSNEVTDLASLMVPRMKDVVRTAISELAQYSEAFGIYGSPATATHAANVLRQAADLWKVECIRSEDDMAETRVTRFIWILKKQIIPVISKTVTENRTRMQRRKKILLPEQSDIDLLTSYVTEGYLRYKTIVSSLSTFSFTEWKLLGMHILVFLMLYNRRRPGELERIYLEDFESLVKMDKENPIYKTLNEQEKQLAERVQLFLIRGKLNRSVNVLLPTAVQEALLVFLSKRNEAGVEHSNPYLFGVPSGDGSLGVYKHLQAGKALVTFSLNCKAKNPSLLRGTILRKDFATRAATFNLPETVASDLADHMGHDRAIHKNIYRQPTFHRSILPVAFALEKALGVTDAEEATSDTWPLHTQNMTRTSTENKTPQKSKTMSTIHQTPPPQKKSRVISPIQQTPPSQKTRSPFCDRISPAQVTLTKKQRVAALAYFNRKIAEFQRELTPRDYEDALKLPELKHLTLPVLRLFYENCSTLPSTPQKVKYTQKQYNCREVIMRRRWSSASLAALKQAFKEPIRSKRLPSKGEILQAQEDYPVLKDRSVACIKVAVSNLRKRLQN